MVAMKLGPAKRSVRTCWLFATALASAACGGGASGAEAPRSRVGDGEARQEGWERPPSASAEIGALNEDDVTATFGAALKDLEACRVAGSRRIEFLGGSVRFFVKIDSGGGVASAHVEKSTLGDRDTEKCMLRVLAKRAWPKPVGGEHGIAKSGFTFEADDIRPPTDWPEERVAAVVSGLAGQLGTCGDTAGFTATVYVDTDGRALGAGVAPRDESGEPHADCVAAALRGAKYPSPGSWPAKVTFGL